MDGPIGYKLEAPSMHPLVVTATVPCIGKTSTICSWLSRIPIPCLGSCAVVSVTAHRVGQGKLRSDDSLVLGCALTYYIPKSGRSALPMNPLLTKAVIAYVVGGCGLAGSAALGATWPDGVHWQLENLSVHEGSLFPTSIGANPQISVYGAVNRLAQALAKRLTGQDVV